MACDILPVAMFIFGVWDVWYFVEISGRGPRRATHLSVGGQKTHLLTSSLIYIYITSLNLTITQLASLCICILQTAWSYSLPRVLYQKLDQLKLEERSCKKSNKEEYIDVFVLKWAEKATKGSIIWLPISCHHQTTPLHARSVRFACICIFVFVLVVVFEFVFVSDTFSCICILLEQIF